MFVRVSATDWLEPEGWTLEETVTVAGWLREAGADVVDTSTGGNITGVTIPSGPGYQVAHATAIKMGSGIVTTAVGQITDAAQAEEIVASGKADAVFVARQFMREPHLPQRWAVAAGRRGRPTRRSTRAAAGLLPDDRGRPSGLLEPRGRDLGGAANHPE